MEPPSRAMAEFPPFPVPLDHNDPMPTYTRNKIDQLWQGLAKGETAPVYLLFGDRYLCRETATQLINRLLPENGPAHNLKKVDGEQENPIKTLNQLRTFGLFAGRQVIRVTDTRLFLSKKVGKNVWKQATEEEPGSMNFCC